MLRASLGPDEALSAEFSTLEDMPEDLPLGAGAKHRLGPPDVLEGQCPSTLGSRQVRSNGSRQALGAMSWWIALGPQVPGW